MKTGLVLEGGGMRGLYTVGVLDALMEQRFRPDYVIGVSAGAGNGISFVSNQKGRAYRVSVEYLADKRYISLSLCAKHKKRIRLTEFLASLPIFQIILLTIFNYF